MKIRFGSVAFAAVPSVAVTLAAIVGGCGGIVRGDGDPDGGGYDRGSGGVTGGVGSGGKVATGASKGSGARPAATGGTTSKPACFNGKLDPGETCDGSIMGITCLAATMGSAPLGTVTCSKTCTWDTSGCRSAIGTGGVTGTGGFTATGGRPATGGVTYDSCMNPTSTILQNACTAPCGCKACPETYAACRADGGCSWILACAQQQGCASVAQCYATSCSSIINTSGGLMSLGSRLADPTLACLAQSGCGVACR
jgi:hypothetical protein